MSATADAPDRVQVVWSPRARDVRRETRTASRLRSATPRAGECAVVAVAQASGAGDGSDRDRKDTDQEEIQYAAVPFPLGLSHK